MPRSCAARWPKCRYRTPWCRKSGQGSRALAPYPKSSPAHGKTVIDNRPTAYVCIGPQCSLSVTEPAALVETVKTARQLSIA